MEERLISKQEVCRLVGYSRAHIDRMVSDSGYRHLEFPKPVKIGFRVFWVWSEIQQWIQHMITSKRDTPV